MNLKQLEIFVEVAKFGSLSRAAASMNKGQPLLSRLVRDFEVEVGTPLLHRTGHGVSLTEAGRRLLARAQHILDEVQQASREMRSLGGTPLTHATIAMPTTVARLVVVDLTREILAAHPGARLHMMESTSGPILEWLLARKVDVAVLYDTVAIPRSLAEPLCQERMHVVRRASLGALPTRMAVRDLEGAPLILPGAGEGLRSLMEIAAAQAGMRLRVEIEADTLSMIKQLVEAGHGYAVLPLTAVHNEVAAGTIAASLLVDPEVSRSLVLATSTARVPAAGLNELVRIVRRVVCGAITGFAEGSRS